MNRTIMMSLLAALSFAACKSRYQNRPIAAPPGFDWQGHRGARGLVPENSIPAFLKALDYPAVTTLELDLAVSKDHQLIVSHEPWFNPGICRLPNGDSIPRRDAEKWLIYQLTAAEIRNFDCGSAGNSRFPQQVRQKTWKPTLREVVLAVRQKAAQRNIRWNIEIKSEPDWDGKRTPPIDTFARLVVDELRSLGIDKSATVQSFDVRALQAMHRIAPDIQLAYLIENVQGFATNMARLGFTPSIYSPYYMTVSRKLVQECHNKGLKIIPWTVNDVPSMRRLIDLGVDGIITDYPNLIEQTGG